ncbi:E3 ubiquitin-protein ligase Midline-1-like [Saccostrea echinata]|uniref:E3 ubiquitin-protein ligase Midline-1-like n=1 Tax=Saccostrea echinata TaxID=191078 RepID=UPI002A82271C|nr:E3 ubiquitin-protein ligase Midline-1-like [Saccostrea echinata]
MISSDNIPNMAQDVIRCSLCTNAVAMHCKSCDVNLCEQCISHHIQKSPTLKNHDLLPYTQKASSEQVINNCKDHPNQICDLYCQDCHIPICSRCLLKNHKRHSAEELSEIYETTRSAVSEDLLELRHFKEEYEKVLRDMEDGLSTYAEESEKERNSLKILGGKWHEILDNAIDRMEEDIMNRTKEDKNLVQDNVDEIRISLQNVDELIKRNENLLKDDDVLNILKYESRVDELRLVPNRTEITPAKIVPLDVKEEEIMQQLVTLTPSTRNTLRGFAITKTGRDFSVSARVLLEKQQILFTIRANSVKLKGICCESTDKVWIYGDDEKLKQFDKLGNMLNCITAISGNSQKDIAVNKDGDVAFSHITDECVKILRERRIQKMVDLSGWIPYGLCFNSDDDLMVCMRRNDYSESKVGIYLGEMLKQEIQYDDTNKPLFSTGRNNMYITENGNGDICVSDWNASAVIVTKKSGEFRFRYTGSLSRSYKEFYPHGIDTDNYFRILVVDRNNDCVHVIDRNGKFLRYINCSLKDPFVLSIDSDENLWVGECDEQNIKVIKYLD